MRIASLYRYPVKGFSPERLPKVTLEAGGYFPGDRMFAIENGPSGFDPASPAHQPKIRFLMLMQNGEIARLDTRYEDASGDFVIRDGGQEIARGNLGEAAGRAQIERCLAGLVNADSLRGPLSVLTAPHGFRFSDSASGYVSLINLASVAALEERLGMPVDPLRFRGNIMLEGLKAWQEFDLIGLEFEARSGVRLKITKRIDRCAATAVEPGTGIRDLPIVRTLMEAYGHIDCGVYAEIVNGGSLSEGQHLTRSEEPSTPSFGIA